MAGKSRAMMSVLIRQKAALRAPIRERAGWQGRWRVQIHGHLWWQLTDTTLLFLWSTSNRFAVI